jgi:hypothetical protein
VVPDLVGGHSEGSKELSFSHRAGAPLANHHPTVPLPKGNTPGTKYMSRFIVWLAVAACPILSAYFGAAAWRASDDSWMDINGRIGPAVK